jgi:SAM-dependent methyltransferase
MKVTNMSKEFLKDCVDWDVVNWSRALRFWEQQVDLENKGFNCLELGGNKGGLSLWLAEKNNTVICSDLELPKHALMVHAKYPEAKKKITYQAIDATNIPFENAFDIIIFKSILGGIGRNGNSELIVKTVNEIYKALKPGGALLFAENLKGSGLHTFLRKKMTAWGNSWNYLSFDEFGKLFLKYGEVRQETTGFLATLGRNETQRQLLGNIDTAVFNRFLGDRMKYIVYGVARK